MATNTLKTRIQHKNGLPAEWEQATNFVPLKGELIVYNDAIAPKIKIGDGSTLVGNLPFVGGSDSTNYLPLTGGTLTGNINIQGADFPTFCLQPTQANGAGTYTGGFFEGSYYDNVSMWVWTDRTNSTKSRRGLVLKGYAECADDNYALVLRKCDTSGNWKNDSYILTSDNFSSYALPLSGGTVTADLKAQGQFQSQSTSTHQYPGLWIRNDENADVGAVYMKPSNNNNLQIRWKRDDGGGDGFYYLSCKAADGSVTAPKFVGPLEGTATKATQDGNGNVITSTYLPLAGGTLTGALNLANNVWNKLGDDVQFGDQNVAGGFVLQGLNGATNITFKQYGGSNTAKISYDGSSLSSSVAFYGAVWNDYAEYRSQNETIEPGYIAYCDDDGKLKKTTERLQKYEGVVSDTFGFAIGKTDDCQTPLAVSGRALVYCDPEEEHFHSGDCVCAGPDGLAYRMTREEIIEFPDRIVGVVSEIPTYKTWGTGNVEVNGRIWIKVR